MSVEAAGTLPPGIAVLAFLVATAAAYTIILWLRPVLRRYALAHPNARSSHANPTPQGGGIAVVAVTVALMVLVPLLRPDVAPNAGAQIASVAGATLLLAVIGFVDDARGLATMPRLGVHILAAAIVLSALPPELRFAPALPLWAERALLLIAVVWFINLVNFMDGLDWMTVAEVVPVCAGLFVAGALGALPQIATLAAVVLAGATLGFAPFNRPVATLFLGDVGSVPIGLLLAWLLILLAGSGHIAAALLLPLYYLADASITLARRLLRGEKVWEAHRTHFYQRATANGASVRSVVAQVAACNVLLALLAAASIVLQSTVLDLVALVLGALLVGKLLHGFAQGR
jgi:UDP-N-acetylmuramyl pentapeptide phosphotransferase/UDP-N-acetylglucosamine-1-phosphate transferase